MESRKAMIPWPLILFCVFVALKFTVAPAMPMWLLFAPLWFPLLILFSFLTILVVAMVLGVLFGDKNG